MKKLCLSIFLSLSILTLHAQNKEAANQLVTEGVALHDNHEYAKAIAKYDEALALDKDNPSALSEKALTMNALGRNEEAVRICREMTKIHPDYPRLNTAYVTYGNALDALRKPEEALKVYEEALRKFPDYYQLYFNKGVTLIGAGQYDNAMKAFQAAVRLNPAHASSHNAIARMADANNQRIPALLAYCRFLILEPESKRAEENLDRVKRLVSRNVERKDDSSISVYVSEETLDDAGKKKNKEDNFSTTDMILSMTTALDYDGKYKAEQPADRLARKLTSVFASMGETSKGARGFFRTYYAPYFTQMEHEHLVDVFCHIALASTNDPSISQWLREHKVEADKFWNWTKAYSWK
jgi:tetratricopeptide (TPR) repeat protein